MTVLNQGQTEAKELKRGPVDHLLQKIRGCTICSKDLTLGPRPILRASTNSKILVVGQAPGTRVHQTGIPWNDPSGERLRSWLEMSSKEFYDESKLAIIPMGFCYPGKGKSGDLPPRKECAENWHPELLPLMKNIKLTLLIGQYAINYFLGNRKKKNLTETVRNYREYLPKFFPLVHPSPRNFSWLKKNPWFDEELVPELRFYVNKVLI
jgi:uracil-DNA glycosylase